MARRRLKQLGATARVGPRTGAAEIPWEPIEAIADRFLRTFSDNCTDDRIKPPRLDPNKDAPVGGTVLVPDLATGQPVPVTVILGPSDEAFHDVSLPATGAYLPTENAVVISPTMGACKPAASWRNILMSVIRHELTHVADPYLYKRNREIERWMNAVRQWAARGGRGPMPSTRGMSSGARQLAEKARRSMMTELRTGQPVPTTKFKDFCAYIRDPGEDKAFRSQVQAELTLVGKRLAASKDPGFDNPMSGIRAMSPTFREVEKCLTPKALRKYQKLAAIAWDSGVIPKKGALSGARRPRRGRRS